MRHTWTAAALVAVMASAGTAQAKLPRGFTEADQETAGGLPVHLVSAQKTVRPQIAYPATAVATRDDGLVDGHLVVPYENPALNGGLLNMTLGGAVERGRMVGEARIVARRLDAAQCRADADLPVRTALQGALEQVGWKTQLQSHAPGSVDVDDLVASGGPRLVVEQSTSLTPDLIWLVTSVTVKAWDGTGSRAPAWQNTLHVASAPVVLFDKTEEDTAVLVSALDAQYAASGNDQRIREINAGGRSADPRQRQRAADTLQDYKSSRRLAIRPHWHHRMQLMRRALFWNGDDCAAMRLAVDDNAAEVARLLQGLQVGTLPVVEQPVAAPAFAEEPKTGTTSPTYVRGAAREVVALAPMVHLSKVAGSPVLLGFVRSVLDESDENEGGGQAADH